MKSGFFFLKGKTGIYSLKGVEREINQFIGTPLRTLSWRRPQNRPIVFPLMSLAKRCSIISFENAQ
jgi:hypothetical protein